jgi:selenocysteine lyase/cysteine desulfurase
MSTKELESYRALFPITEHWTYLNHAAVSGLCRPALAALERYLAEQSTTAVYSELEYFPWIDQNRVKMARLIGADHDEIAWMPNTATAISLIAHSLPWREGDNVVTTDEQFPANVYPWLELEQYGVHTHLVRRQDGRVPLDRLAAQIDDRTRLVAVSWVEFNSGFRQDLAALSAICHERGALLLVDAIQGLGGLQAQVHDWGVDFFAAGTHKWMLGPQGLGVLYIRRDRLDVLRPHFLNWRSVQDQDNYLDYRQPWLPAARRYEGSTPNLLGHVALGPVLDLHLEVGPARIEAQVLALTDRLIAGLLAHGHDLVSSQAPGERSGVVCFRPRGGEDPVAAVERLRAAQISVAARSGVVRVSPHFYNTMEEIDSLFAPGLLG